MTLRWTLTPHMLMAHVWLYPKIIVSNSHGNTSKCVDTVTIFQKINQKGQWPQDDLWLHFCWGHMCDSTQGLLYPSSMKIHQSMWIQWLFFKNLVTKGQRKLFLSNTHMGHTYYVQNEWSHSLLLNKVQARQKAEKYVWVHNACLLFI